MINKSKVIVEVGTVEEFFDRVRSHAALLDREQPVVPGIRITFEDAEEMETFLSNSAENLP